MQVESRVTTFNDPSSRVDNVLSTSKVCAVLLYIDGKKLQHRDYKSQEISKVAGIYAGGKNIVYCHKANGVLMT